jgi:hypothetical protein
LIKEFSSESEKDFFIVDDSTFKLFEFDRLHFEIFLKLAAILSFLTPNAQKSKIIQDIILFKLISQIQSNIVEEDRFNNKIDKFTLDFITTNNFNTDFSKLFDLITLEELIFQVIVSIPNLERKNILKTFYQYILQYFIPKFSLKELRKDLDSISPKIHEIFRSNSSKNYTKFRNYYNFEINFLINYQILDLQVIRVSCIFQNHISLKILTEFISHQLLFQVSAYQNYFVFYLISPSKSVENIDNFFKKLKNRNKIKDYSLLIKQTHHNVVNFDVNLPSTTLIRDFSPFFSLKFFSQIDLRKKSNLILSCKKIQFDINFSEYKRINLSYIERIFLIFSRFVSYFPDPSSLSKFLGLIKNQIQLHPFFQKMSTTNKNFSQIVTPIPSILKLLNIGQFPLNSILNNSYLSQLNNISNYTRNEIPIDKAKICQIISSFLKFSVLIPNIPLSIIELHYFNPEIVHLRIITSNQNEIIENSLFYYEKNRWMINNSSNLKYLYDLVLESQYFSLLLKYLSINSDEIYIMNRPISSERFPIYLCSYFDFKKNEYKDQWYYQKLEELINAFPKTKGAKKYRQIEISIKNTIAKQFSYRDFYRDLNFINQFRLHGFRNSPKQNYVEFLLAIYQNRKEISEIKNKIKPKSFKVLEQSIPKFLPPESFQSMIFIMITIQTHDQNISPYILMMDDIWKGLYQFGLLEYHYACSSRFSFQSFLYTIPLEIFHNRKSPFQRFLIKIQKIGHDAVKIYIVGEELRSINPPMLFPEDQIKKNYLNFDMKNTQDVYPEIELFPNSYRKHITSLNYEFPQIKESLLFSFCYNTNLLIFIPDLDNIPNDLIHFFEQNPINRTFLLDSVDLPPNNSTNKKNKAILCLVSLNRYVNHYYNTVYRTLSERFPDQSFGLTHIINFPWTHPKSPITNIIKTTKNAYYENAQKYLWLMYNIPLFMYRQQNLCFSPEIRLHLLEILRKDPYRSQITDKKLNLINKALTDLIKEDTEPDQAQIEERILEIFTNRAN